MSIGFAINKYTYVLVKKRKDKKIFLKYSENEVVDINNTNDIKHDFIRNTLKYLDINYGLEIINFADITTKGSGLGSSSSFLVSLLNALYSLNGLQISKEKIAKDACYIEIDMCGKKIGFQDQYWASIGGFNRIIFEKNGHVLISNYNFGENELKYVTNNILVFNTGIVRDSSVVLDKQTDNLNNDKHVIDNMYLNVQLAKDLHSKLMHKNFDAIGKTLLKNWELKKTFSNNITNEFIDKIMNISIDSGADGGKITGARRRGIFDFIC